MKDRINQWKQMEANRDPEADAFFRKMVEEAKEEGKMQEIEILASELLASANSRMDAVEHSIKEYTLHEQLGQLTEVINLAYIARHYFGRTRQWLYQRLKGQQVNGRPASFTPDELELFSHALNEVGIKLCTVAPSLSKHRI